MFPLLRFGRVVGLVRGVSEVGSRALAAVADGAAEVVDRVRPVGVEVEPGGNGVALGVEGRRAVGQMRVRGEDRLHGRAIGVGVIASAVDALVAGRAAVVAGNVLEVVVDREIGQADLLNLGRRNDVDARHAAHEREKATHAVFIGAAVQLGLLRDCPLDAVDFAGQPVAFLVEAFFGEGLVLLVSERIAADEGLALGLRGLLFFLCVLEFDGDLAELPARSPMTVVIRRSGRGALRLRRSCRRRGCVDCRVRP